MQVLMQIMDWIPPTLCVFSILTQFSNWLFCFDWPLLDTISFAELELEKKTKPGVGSCTLLHIFLIILKKLHITQKVNFHFHW